MSMYNECTLNLMAHYWNCNFPMAHHVCRSVGLDNYLKGGNYTPKLLSEHLSIP